MRQSRQLFTALVLLLLMMTMAVPVLALETFSINSYDIVMDVRSDNSYLITESIDVTYSQKSHGIVRVLPLKNYRGDKVIIDSIKVPGQKYVVSKSAGKLEIKIGDADKYAASNENYVISYVWHDGDDKMKNMDELYFNLVGLEWDCPIKNVSFTINMPAPFDSSRLNFTYGKKGSTIKAPLEMSSSGKTISGRLIKDLGPGEALTIALPLNQGYFVDMPKTKTSPVDFLGWIVSPVIFLAGIGIWSAIGKAEKYFPTVEFYPPKGATSADVGYLIDGKVDSFDVTSLIIYWADRGYLSITQRNLRKRLGGVKKSFLLTKLREMGMEGKDYEQLMFRDLFDGFGDGRQVDTANLEERFYPTVSKVMQQVQYGFSDELEIFSSKNGICRWLIRLCSWGAAFVPLWPVLREVAGDESVSAVVMVAMYALIITVMLHILLTAGSGWREKRTGERGIVILWSAFSLVIIAVTFYLASNAGMIAQMAIGIICAALLLMLSCRCNRRTELGKWYVEKLTGFKEFLKATELDRIKLLVNDNPQYFYNVLPYAMVLGVTDKWAKNFDSIALQPPNWYQSVGGAYFQPSLFANELRAGLQTINFSMNSRPAQKNTGSSDGGSAGGGSGGGGGRSW